MAFNPAKSVPHVSSPIERANEVNDPDFVNRQGYYPYDLTHQEFISPRFGEVTPKMHLDTAPADRHVILDDDKTVLNQIDGNFLSTINQYSDTFYVPLRSVFPNNYEKLIPNPTKGDDLPNSALPQCPINLLVNVFLNSPEEVVLFVNDEELSPATVYDIMSTDISPNHDVWKHGRMALLATVFSRGQLLDYLGLQYDTAVNSLYSEFQKHIDLYFEALFSATVSENQSHMIAWSTSSDVEGVATTNVYNVFDVQEGQKTANTRSEWRSLLSDFFEAGQQPYFIDFEPSDALNSAYDTLYNDFEVIFASSIEENYLETLDASPDPFRVGFVNIGKIVAYQQCIAQYYTNDRIDNIFTSELYMQLMRSIMFPTQGSFSQEPTFVYNGVNTEYDLISTGAIYHAFVGNRLPGSVIRLFQWFTVVMLLRRSLRYGDYFTTARPRMLAVGDLSINVEDGMVSPVDVTRNLLAQRYLNAGNYIGSGFLPYYNSIYGVQPSDTGCYPRFISHRKYQLDNQVTNNTADNQGKQTTNLVGFTDSEVAADVFIDDFGYILSFISYDVLPVYTSGIDNSYHLADRFDYFNPMLQGVGDQQVYLSELVGKPSFRENVFGYTMRNAEYKMKVSRAHGAFESEGLLAGFLLRFPLYTFNETYAQQQLGDLHINPDFIRDKPLFLDPVIPVRSGLSPANYFHFVVSCTNVVKSARKIQELPPVLF